MGEIFLSYSRHDQGFADAVTRGLQDRDLQVWVDRQDIQAGDEWRAAISQAIAECDAFLVVLSPQCIASQNVVKELSLAETRHRHIVPIMYQPCEIPPSMDYTLTGLQWIDFSEMTFEDAFERLVAALRSGHGKASSASVAAGPSRPPMAASPGPFSTPARPFPPAQPVPQVNAAQELARLLCGRWNIQIQVAYVGAVAQIVLDLSPNGVFTGQIMKPGWLSAVNGVWQVTPTGQLLLNGQETTNFIAIPYAALIQFAQVSPTVLVATSNTGEQLTWSRIG